MTTAIKELHFRFDKHRKSGYLHAHSYLNDIFSSAIDFTLADLYVDSNIKSTLKHDAVDRIMAQVVNNITNDSRTKDTTRISPILNRLPLYCDLSNGDERVQLRTVADLSIGIENAGHFGHDMLCLSFKIDSLNFWNTDCRKTFDDISFVPFTASAERHVHSFQQAADAARIRSAVALRQATEAARIQTRICSIAVFYQTAEAARIRSAEALRLTTDAARIRSAAALHCADIIRSTEVFYQAAEAARIRSTAAPSQAAAMARIRSACRPICCHLMALFLVQTLHSDESPPS